MDIKISNILKELRRTKDVKQEDVAKAIGITKSGYGYYEQGRSMPDPEMLLKLAKYFNVSVDYLLGNDKSKNLKYDSNNQNEYTEFKTPQEAIKFILNQNVIMGFGGFDPNKMSDDEILDFANELLNQLKLLGYKYKK